MRREEKVMRRKEKEVMKGEEMEEEQRLRNCERMVGVMNQDEADSKSQKGEKKDEVEVGSGNQVMGKVVEEEEKER